MIQKVRDFLTNLFGWLAVISIALLLLCAFLFSYVGVSIQYALIPSVFIFSTLWWLIHPDKKIKNEL